MGWPLASVAIAIVLSIAGVARCMIRSAMEIEIERLQSKEQS